MTLKFTFVLQGGRRRPGLEPAAGNVLGLVKTLEPRTYARKRSPLSRASDQPVDPAAAMPAKAKREPFKELSIKDLKGYLSLGLCLYLSLSWT